MNHRIWRGLWTIAALTMCASVAVDARADEEAADLSGSWKIAIQMDEATSLNAIVDVSKNEEGYGGHFNLENGLAEGDLKEVTVEGDALSFKVEADMQGQTLVAEFKVKLEGGKFTGSVDYDLGGAPGTLDVAGEKLPIVAEGIWKLAISTPDGLELTPRLNVTKNGDSLGGTFHSDDGSTVEATELSLDAAKLSWGTVLDFGGQELIAKWSAAVLGDKLNGTVEYDLGGQVGELEFSAARAKVETVATWSISVTTEDGQALESSLILVNVDGELDGKYIGITGEEVELKNLMQDGDKLAFEFSADIGGETLSGKFDGTVDGDKYTGTVSYELAGQPGELPFEGKKAEEDDDEDDDDDDDEDDDDDDDDDEEEEE